MSDSDSMLRAARKKKAKVESNIHKKVLFENNVMLIKPVIDASDKELHLRNDMAYASKNLLRFIDANANVDYASDVYKPEKLGEMTRDNVGTV